MDDAELKSRLDAIDAMLKGLLSDSVAQMICLITLPGTAEIDRDHARTVLSWFAEQSEAIGFGLDEADIARKLDDILRAAARFQDLRRTSKAT